MYDTMGTSPMKTRLLPKVCWSPRGSFKSVYIFSTVSSLTEKKCGKFFFPVRSYVTIFFLPVRFVISYWAPKR